MKEAGEGSVTAGELLEVSGSYWKSCALQAAVKLDLFSRLSGGPHSAEEIARRLEGSPRGVAYLLNALCAMGLAVKDADRYEATAPARRFLAPDSNEYIGHILMHHHHLLPSWGRLDEAVLSGRPVRDRSSTGSDKWRESFLMGMFNMAMATAPRLVPALDLTGRRRLLDFGGGPGTYAIHFCRANPQLKAVVFDLPTTRVFAEKTIARFHLAERIGFVAGDYHTDAIEGPFDVAWLSHILHAEGPEACLQIVRKAAAALEPGGLLAIHEFILNDSGDGPLFPALFALNMLLGTTAGRAYSEGELAAMLKAAGARSCERLPVRTPNDSGIIVGRF
jgi:SAM-dependent methyltransferase